jgi:lipopolysaccharide export system permease protein
MQFLFVYIDDVIGKGLSTYVILKFVLLVTLTLLPKALPLAILFASIMTFGNLAEHHELVSLKSAGFPLPLIMSSLFILVFLISAGAFLFSNYMLPIVNLKENALLYDIQHEKPALNIEQGVFYNGISGYSMRIGEKDEDQETVHDVKIYDHTENAGNNNQTMAKSGKMKMSADQRYLVLTLYDGTQYEDVMDNARARISHPMQINTFKEMTIYFDLSSFRFTRTNEDLYKYNYEMLDLRQLVSTADSMSKSLAKNKAKFTDELYNTYLSFQHFQPRIVPGNVPAGMKNMNVIYDAASNLARNTQRFLEGQQIPIHNDSDGILKCRLECHHKFTFPFACFVLFLIGAPLGAIIKKGGLGMPVIVSAFFFILYFILTSMGEKFAREGVLSVVSGAWLADGILFPIGIYFIYIASRDSGLFEGDRYFMIINRVREKIKKLSA